MILELGIASFAYLFVNRHKSNKKDIAVPFWSNVRSQHLQTLTSDENDVESSQYEKKINKELKIVVGSFGIGILSLFYNPLIFLSRIGFIYGCIPSAEAAYHSITKRNFLNVDVLTAVTSVMFISQGQNLLILGHFANITSSLSRKLLIKVQDNSTNSCVEVFEKQPSKVYVLIEDVEIEKNFKELEINDIVVISAGETIPIDGIIVDGVASVDQQSLTGEAQPVEKMVGHEIFALTIVISGKIYVKVERKGEETTAAKIGSILNNTADFKSTTQLQAENIANNTILPLVIISTLSYPFLGLNSAITVLNSHPKYRMTVVAPIGMLNYLDIAFHKGILIKDGRMLELINKVDTVVFDKTGTLTISQPHVHEIYSFSNKLDKKEILTYIAAAEYKQTHPIALAIFEKATSLKLIIPEADEMEYKIGYGIEAIISNKSVLVGSIPFMKINQLSIPKEAEKFQKYCHTQGYSFIVIAIDSEVVGAIELHSTIREEARQMIKQFKQRNIKSMYIISGDQEAPTKKIAQSLGIDNYFSEVLPEDKANIIKKLQDEGRFVCYIGDGINDSIALKRANVSISLRGASSVAVDTAHVILMNGNLKELISLFELSDEFIANQKSSFVSLFSSSVIGITGALFFHLSFYNVSMLNQIGFLTGLSNAMVPWLKNKNSKKRMLLKKD
jgi:Cu2+-exporting ATPase